MARHQVEPEWVLVDGVRHHVSDYRYILPKERPEAICPVCNSSVIFKLGLVNAHHYAHATAIDCSANHSETALHLNTKFHIYSELVKGMRTGLTLKVSTSCAGECKKRREDTWASGWDDVKVENSIDPIRPDIVILKGGSTIGAIEVCASNAVSESKSTLFDKKGLQWIEVQADKNIYSGAKPWHLCDPLPYMRLGHAAYSWKCDYCIEHEKALEKIRNEQAIRAKDVASSIRVAFHNPPKYQKPPSSKTPWHYFDFPPGNKPELTCVSCGKLTSDWFDREKDGVHCKCRACLPHFFSSGNISPIAPDEGSHHTSPDDDDVPF